MGMVARETRTEWQQQGWSDDLRKPFQGRQPKKGYNNEANGFAKSRLVQCNWSAVAVKKRHKSIVNCFLLCRKSSCLQGIFKLLHIVQPILCSAFLQGCGSLQSFLLRLRP